MNLVVGPISHIREELEVWIPRERRTRRLSSVVVRRMLKMMMSRHAGRMVYHGSSSMVARKVSAGRNVFVVDSMKWCRSVWTDCETLCVATRRERRVRRMRSE